ncbi:MAG: hypothetical protein H0W88_10685 [Parachlamydiaceae bacterium]|nr:hypothetical protein [Parachlamydiaceae bacterium]
MNIQKLGAGAGAGSGSGVAQHQHSDISNKSDSASLWSSAMDEALGQAVKKCDNSWKNVFDTLQQNEQLFRNVPLSEAICKDRFTNFADPNLDPTELNATEKAFLDFLLKKHGTKTDQIFAEFHLKKIEWKEGRRTNLILADYIKSAVTNIFAMSTQDSATSLGSLKTESENDDSDSDSSSDNDGKKIKVWEERDVNALKEALKIFKPNKYKAISQYLQKRSDPVYKSAHQCQSKIESITRKAGTLSESERAELMKLHSQYPNRLYKIARLMNRTSGTVIKTFKSIQKKIEKEKEFQKFKDSIPEKISGKRKEHPTSPKKPVKKKPKIYKKEDNKTESTKRKKTKWKQEEIDALNETVKRIGEKKWAQVSRDLKSQGIEMSPNQCFSAYTQRAKNLSKDTSAPAKRKRWTDEELNALLKAVEKIGIGKWTAVSDALKLEGIDKIPERCLQKYNQHTNKKTDEKSTYSNRFNKWSKEENETLQLAIKKHGTTKWTEISRFLKKEGYDRGAATCKNHYLDTTTESGPLSPSDCVRLEALLDNDPSKLTYLGRVFNRTCRWIGKYNKEYQQRKLSGEPRKASVGAGAGAGAGSGSASSASSRLASTAAQMESDEIEDPVLKEPKVDSSVDGDSNKFNILPSVQQEASKASTVPMDTADDEINIMD